MPSITNTKSIFAWLKLIHIQLECKDLAEIEHIAISYSH